MNPTALEIKTAITDRARMMIGDAESTWIGFLITVETRYKVEEPAVVIKWSGAWRGNRYGRATGFVVEPDASPASIIDAASKCVMALLINAKETFAAVDSMRSRGIVKNRAGYATHKCEKGGRRYPMTAGENNALTCVACGRRFELLPSEDDRLPRYVMTAGPQVIA